MGTLLERNGGRPVEKTAEGYELSTFRARGSTIESIHFDRYRGRIAGAYRSLTDFKDMPKPNQTVLEELNNKQLNEESQYNVAEETCLHETLLPKLNVEQRKIYEEVVNSVLNKERKLFFVYGAGGTGKTFLYKTIISALRSMEKHVVPVETVLLGGDFRQILPVITKGTRQETVAAAINRSHLWDSCVKFKLSKNMRVDLDEKDFAKWILKVGDGDAPKRKNDKEGYQEEDEIEIDESLMLPNDKNPLEVLCGSIYPDITETFRKREILTEGAILTPRNETVDEINSHILSTLPGLQQEYFSADSVGEDEEQEDKIQMSYPLEYLNSLEFPGIPSHRLCLKVVAPIMLIRNLHPKKVFATGRG